MAKVGAPPALSRLAVIAASATAVLVGVTSGWLFTKQTPTGTSVTMNIICWKSSSGGTGVCITETGQIRSSGSVVAQGASLSSGATVAGWTDDGQVVRLTTVGDHVGIGTTTAKSTLTVAGSGAFTKSMSGNTLFVQSGAFITGRLGVGTRSPSSPIGALQVVHISNPTSAGLRLEGSTNGGNAELSAGAGLYIDSYGHSTASNNFIAFRTENSVSQQSPTEHMRIDSSGNVGIGDTNPTSKLDVGGDIITSTQLTAANVIMLSNELRKTVDNLFLDIRGGTNTDAGRIVLYGSTHATPGLVLINGGLTANAHIGLQTASTGNVGIGTATPSAKLSVVGTMSGRNLYISGTGATPRLTTVQATGNVGIGTADPKSKLDVVGTLSGSAVNISGTAAPAGSAVCIKAGGLIGYCSSVVGAGGTCTCN